MEFPDWVQVREKHYSPSPYKSWLFQIKILQFMLDVAKTKDLKYD